MIAGVASIAPAQFTRALTGPDRSDGQAVPSGAAATHPIERAGDSAIGAAAEPESARPVEPASETEKSKTVGGEELTEGEERQVRELQQRDREVRAHEQAHAVAGGPYASPPSYQFTTGPDGKRYAVSGEVKIDSSPVRDNPEATIRKMDIVIRAALAPAEPSSQDLQVARQAQQERAKAQIELTRQKQEELEGRRDGGEPTADAGQSPLQRAVTDAIAAYEEAGRRGDAGPRESAVAELSQLLFTA
ncbi:MAG: hypothetical protein MI824_03880 [Hyphomicrobiales bacterium]|nr:hypothetical protein [Hyphomicrobiales bacterium]